MPVSTWCCCKSQKKGKQASSRKFRSKAHVLLHQGKAHLLPVKSLTGQMPRRALHLVFEWLDQHKDELMMNWERMENGETLVKINPLD